METMKWEQKPYDHSENRNGRGNPGAPTIKNHSVTYFSGYLYCFGGYDGRKNHMTLLMYSIEEQRWLRPHQVENNEAAGEGAAVEGNDVNNDDNDVFRQPEDEEGRPARGLRFRNDILNDELEPHVVPFQPYRHPYHQHDYAAGDRRIMMYGDPPPGRNGHSASLAIDPDNKDNAKIIIIGGWLGTGPLAASDMHVLDISNEGRELRWSQPPVQGTPPGACNMHSADYVPARREVYVFRGGNGREYLNDLHALNVQTMTWRKVETTGEIPQQRANHSSAFLEETGELVVFGGWYVVRFGNFCL
jgi:Galactose oxidase, central domain/Kelch motif